MITSATKKTMDIVYLILILGCSCAWMCFYRLLCFLIASANLATLRSPPLSAFWLFVFLVVGRQVFIL